MPIRFILRCRRFEPVCMPSWFLLFGVVVRSRALCWRLLLPERNRHSLSITVLLPCWCCECYRVSKWFGLPSDGIRSCHVCCWHVLCQWRRHDLSSRFILCPRRLDSSSMSICILLPCFVDLCYELPTQQQHVSTGCHVSIPVPMQPRLLRHQHLHPMCGQFLLRWRRSDQRVSCWPVFVAGFLGSLPVQLPCECCIGRKCLPLQPRAPSSHQSFRSPQRLGLQRVSDR